jgi:hypothetical protein
MLVVLMAVMVMVMAVVTMVANGDMALTAAEFDFESASRSHGSAGYAGGRADGENEHRFAG